MAKRKCKKQCATNRIKKNKSVCHFAYLHIDILLNILRRLPVELLRYKFKYVSKRWFHIITNRILFDAHRDVCRASLIIQNPNIGNGYDYKTRLLEFNEGKLNLKLKGRDLDVPCRGRIRSWCNDLFLITDPFKRGALYLFNHVTKEEIALPPCSSYCSGHTRCKCGLGLAFDPSKAEYKVVHVFFGLRWLRCEILVMKREALSFDFSKWKRIIGPPYTGQRHYYWDDPVSVEGRVFHWDVHSSKYIVSMDIVEQKFRQTCLPECDTFVLSNGYFFIEMGGFLSLLLPASKMKIDIWILKDFSGGVWEKQQCIETVILSHVPSKIYPARILPIASLENGNIIIFRRTGTDSCLFAYDIKGDRMTKLQVEIGAKERCLFHVNSLRSWITNGKLSKLEGC